MATGPENAHYGNSLTVAGKSRGSSNNATAAGGRRDLAEGSIQPRPEVPGEVQGLARVVAQGKQIGLLPGAPMRYPSQMDYEDTISRPPPVSACFNALTSSR